VSCFPGAWRGNPKFTYAWYTIAGFGARQLVGRGQTYTPDVGGEGLNVLCVVTATNVAGSHLEDSNISTVKVHAAHADSAPYLQYDVRKPDLPVASIRSNGVTLIGEQIVLTCKGAHWNRSDIRTSFQWFMTDYKGHELSAGRPGQQLALNMTPANLQYQMFVRCVETATTSNGASSEASSSFVQVWNGCRERYTEDLNPGLPGPIYDGFGVLHWLDAQSFDPNPWVFRRDLTRVNGLFGLFGFSLLNESSGEGPYRAVTDGPNCLDYQKYLEDKGYDVKQWPTNPDDWLTRS
jgi:hypothetical protein